MINNNKLKAIIKSPIIKGTVILTVAGVLTRVIGFFFRIFLSRCIGAEGVGIYQLIFPIQILCYSLCTSGIETALSRLIAGISKKDKKKPILILKSGLILSLSISIVTAFIIFANASFIANRIIMESRCTNLIKWMAPSIPLASIHACICGYYLGLKKTSVPAWSQFVEQCVRVFSIYVIILVCNQNQIHVTPVIAVIGSLVGELASVLYSIFCISGLEKNADNVPANKSKVQLKKYYLKDIFMLSFPLTLNRVMLSVLHTIQNVLIPNRLIYFGLSTSAALSIYGITNGLVLPLIMFPGALINSFALLLLPTIAQADYSNNTERINKASTKSFIFSSVFGIYCAGIFLKFGPYLGIILFSNKESGKYISLLGFLCPFFYITMMLATILNGLGKTTITFLLSTISVIIQIIFTIFAIPILGIFGYLLGLLVSSIISSVSHYISLKKYVQININAITTYLIPIMTIYTTCNFVSFLSNYLFFVPLLIKLIIDFSIISCVYFFMNLHFLKKELP